MPRQTTYQDPSEERIRQCLDEAIELLEPPDDSKEAVRTKLKVCIDFLIHINSKANRFGSPAEIREKLAEYLEALRKAEKHASGVLSVLTPVSWPFPAVVENLMWYLRRISHGV